jgi:hypothetical protein
MAVTSVTAAITKFVVDGSTPANNNTFYVDYFGSDGSYSSSLSVNVDVTQTAQQVADAISTAVANAVNAALGTSLTAANVILMNRPSAGQGYVASGDIASGSIGRFHIASGAVLSGHIASGQIGANHLASGLIDLVFTSGVIQSGLVGDAAVNSGNIGSGQVGSFHISSGAVTSGNLGNNAVTSGTIASGQIAGPHLASGVLNVISGNLVVASGSVIISGPAGVSGTLTSQRYVLGLDLALIPIVGNQSVISTWWGLQLKGNMQSNVDHSPTAVGANNAFSVVVPNQQPGATALGVVAASGQTGDLQRWLGSGAGVVYAAVNASGEFRGLIASGAVRSGSIASGQVSTQHFASRG